MENRDENCRHCIILTSGDCGQHDVSEEVKRTQEEKDFEEKINCNVCDCDKGTGHEWVCGDFCDVGGVKTFFLFCKWCALTKQTGVKPW